MKKKNKKQKPLSDLMKITAEALGVRDFSDNLRRQAIQRAKENYREIANTFRMEHPWDAPKSDSYTAMQILQKFQSTDQSQTYSVFVRDFLLGYWLSHKVIYRVPQKTVEFLHSKFQIGKTDFPMNKAIWNICHAPIYIEFESTVSGYRGAFCGCTKFTNEAYGPGKRAIVECPALMLCGMREGSSKLEFYQGPNMGIRQTLDTDLEFSLLYEIIAYIELLRENTDAEETYLPKAMDGDTEIHTVLPLSDELADVFTNHQSWMRIGTSVFLGYLDQNRMLRQFKENLKNNHWAIKQTIQLNPPTDALRNLIEELILDWEQRSHVVYQYKQDVLDFVYSKYRTEICEHGISPELLKYLPYHTLILNQEDVSVPTPILVSSKIAEEDGTLLLSLIFLHGGCVIPVLIPCEAVANKEAATYKLIPPCDDKMRLLIENAICMVYHILHILSKKNRAAVKKKSIASSNAVLSMEHDDLQKEKDGIRVSYTLGSDHPQVFDITSRTVKRVLDGEAAKRNGWVMTPHIRRRHPHRYWVGSGETRHLEVRWLDEMGIHMKEGENVGITVVHELKK